MCYIRPMAETKDEAHVYSVVCPCCGATLWIDGGTKSVLRSEKAKKANRAGFFASLEVSYDTYERLKRYADFIRPIRPETLKASQLPDPIPGTNIHKPKSW